MAIFGMAAGVGGAPVDIAKIVAMGEASKISAADDVKTISSENAAFGAVSRLGTSSVYQSKEITVCCDADLLDLESLRNIAELPKEASVAEIVARLFQCERENCFGSLRGSFALGIWERKSGQVTLALDRFAVKPLCYSVANRRITFASYPTAIFASGSLKREVNPEAIVEYLHYSVVPAPQCAFANVTKVLPGNFVTWKDGTVTSKAYWDLQYTETSRGPEGQLANEMLERMTQAVKYVSDGVNPSEIGCFLSGGTDSSSVLGLLGRTQRCKPKSYSVGFAEDRFNELEYAHIAVRQFEADHHEVVLGPERTREVIPQIVALYDEPFGNSSAIPTYECVRFARETGVQTMLAGDGGDELFGGNERYATDRIFTMYQDIPRLLRRGFLEPVVFHLPGAVMPVRKARRYIEKANIPNPDRFFQYHLLKAFKADEILGPVMGPTNGNRDFIARARQHYQNAPATSELNKLLYIDIKMTLGDNDLPKVVRTAELAGVKVRFPYLDGDLADFSGRLAANLKVRGFEKRYLFKKATAELLPQAILKKKKHGFGLPIGYWIKSYAPLRKWSEEVLLDPLTYQRGYFQKAFVQNLFEEMDRDDTPYYGDLIWLFLMLELWHRHHVEGKTV